MQSEQVDSERLRKTTPLANYTHRLIIFSYFLTQRLVTATLLIDLLIDDRFLIVVMQLKSMSRLK